MNKENKIIDLLESQEAFNFYNDLNNSYQIIIESFLNGEFSDDVISSVNIIFNSDYSYITMDISCDNFNKNIQSKGLIKFQENLKQLSFPVDISISDNSVQVRDAWDDYTSPDLIYIELNDSEYDNKKHVKFYDDYKNLLLNILDNDANKDYRRMNSLTMKFQGNKLSYAYLDYGFGEIKYNGNTIISVDRESDSIVYSYEHGIISKYLSETLPFVINLSSILEVKEDVDINIVKQSIYDEINLVKAFFNSEMDNFKHNSSHFWGIDYELSFNSTLELIVIIKGFNLDYDYYHNGNYKHKIFDLDLKYISVSLQFDSTSLVYSTQGHHHLNSFKPITLIKTPLNVYTNMYYKYIFKQLKEYFNINSIALNKQDKILINLSESEDEYLTLIKPSWANEFGLCNKNEIRMIIKVEMESEDLNVTLENCKLFYNAIMKQL